MSSTVSKFSVSLMPKVAAELQIRVGEDGNRSMEINKALKHWYTMMRQAKKNMEPQFSRGEKGMIIAATNGSLIDDMPYASFIWMNVQDANEDPSLAEQWEVDDPEALIQKLKQLTPPECLALAEAIRDWWGASENPEDLLKTEEPTE